METLSSINRWFASRPEDMTMLEKLLKIIIILVAIKVLTKVAYVLIDNFFKREQMLKLSMKKRKAKTLAAIIKSVCKYLFYFIGLIPILEVFGISTSSILATAGVGGLAIGFGAQSLVKDIITGFFILFEDYFSVGDYIKTSNYEGIVEEIGIRSTRLRAFSGDLYIIPNGYIETVTNMSRGDMRALIDIRISYKDDIDNAIEALDAVALKMIDDEDINAGPTVLGVTNLAKEDIVLSIQAMVKPMQQWSIERKLRKAVKEEFQKRGITISDGTRVFVERETEKE